MDAETRTRNAGIGRCSDAGTPRRSAVGLTRRRVLLVCAGVAGSLAGCLSAPGDDDEFEEPEGTFHVRATSTFDQPVQLQVALVEGDASFEESRTGTFHLRNSDTLESTHDGVRGGPFRVVVRVAEGDWTEFETTWDLGECIEFTLQPTVTADELAVSWACTSPPDGISGRGPFSTRENYRLPISPPGASSDVWFQR